MKVIANSQGIVGLQVSADDVTPKSQIMMRDIIEFIAQSYQFAVKPQIPPNIPPFMIPIFVFQSGQFVIGDEKLPIIQLVPSFRMAILSLPLRQRWLTGYLMIL
jgi:hypothetical protein